MNKRIALAGFYMCCVVFLITVQSCSEKAPTKVFDELTDSTAVGSAKFLLIPKPEFANTDVVTVNTGASPFLYLGQADGKISSFAMKFLGLPDSLVVTEAKLVLKSSAFFGTPGGMLTASVHEIKKNWQERELTFSDIGADFFEPASLGNLTFAAADSDTIIISFDAELVNRWIALPDSERFGILVRPDGAFALEQFNSSEALAGQPKLQLFHDDSTRASPLEFFAAEDAFIFEVLNQPADGPLYVGNGFEHKSIIRFDLAKIPKNATINRAKLIVKIDSINSFLSPNDGFSLGAETLLEEIPDLATSVDSLITTSKIFPLSTTLGVVDTSKTLTLNLNNQLQEWTAGRQDNLGLIFMSRTPGRDLYRVALHISPQDTLNTPKLEIHYTTPPIAKRKNNAKSNQ